MIFSRHIYFLRSSHTFVSNRNFSISFVRRNVATELKKEDPKSAIPDEESLKLDKDVNIAGRTERRKETIAPFVKDIMLAEYNRDLLAFPEIMNQDENKVLTRHLESARFTLREFKSEPDIFRSLSTQRITTAPLAAFHNGLACNLTERLRLLEELSVNIEVAKRVADNWSGLDSIQMSLPKSEADLVLPGIVQDGRLISMCLSEKMCEEFGKADFLTKAIMKVDGSWILSGTKHCVNHDSYKIVLAVTPSYKMYPFLIEPNAPGITYDSEWVKFDETPALRLTDKSKEKSVEDMTDEEKFEECLMEPIARLRLYKGLLACALLKKLMLKVVPYIRNKYVGGNPYADFPFTQDKVTEASLTAYTAEAMLYFTAGLGDGYLTPDTNVEMAMCRIFSTERCFEAAQQLLSTLGRDSLLPEWDEHYIAIRDLLYEDCENNDSLRIYTGSLSMKHAGISMAKQIKMMRNPLFNPLVIFKHAFKNRHNEIDDPKLTIKLEEHLHPSLQASARNLEYCVHRLKYGCETVLTRHGTQVTDVVRDVKRLSMASTEIYAMSAAIARASRAYCVGLSNSNYDMAITPQIIEKGKRRVKELINDIDLGEYTNFDASRAQIGESLLDHKGELAEHSLERSFW